MNSVILNDKLIVILSLAALFALLAARVIKVDGVSVCLNIAGFLCVAAAVTYAFLIGAVIDEVLIYLLVYTLIASFEFVDCGTTDAALYAPADNGGAQTHSVSGGEA